MNKLHAFILKNHFILRDVIIDATLLTYSTLYFF